MTQQSNAGFGLALAVGSSACFATSGPFARALTEAGWTTGAAVVARVGLAALVLAVPAIIALRGRSRALRRSFGMVAFYGLVAVAGCQFFFFNSVQSLSVGVALLIEYLGLVLVVGWLWAARGQRPRRLTIAGSVVAIAGLVLMLDLTGDSRLDPIGVLWGLGAAVGLAVYFVLSSRDDSGLPPVAVASVGMGVGAVALLALGLTGALPLRATFGTLDLAGTRASWLVPVLGLSLVGAAVAYVAGIGAARRLGPKLASFVGLTEVAFAVLFAWILLDELPTSVQLLGGVLIVAGVALVRLDELRSPAPQTVTTQAADAGVPVTAGAGR